MPAYPAAPAPAPHASLLSGRAVPVVLLLLGGLFVVTAVSLFLAVTWHVLPLVIKALLMLAVTVGFGCLAVLLSRRGLRGSAEAIWALVAVLLMLDLSAGHRSGLLWLDALSGRSATALGGALLIALGLPVALWAHRVAIRRSVAAEATLVSGVLAVAFAEAWTRQHGTALAVSIMVPALAGFGVALHTRLRASSYAVLGVAALTWLVLPMIAMADAYDGHGRAGFWHGFHGWPLLVAAAYAGSLTLVGRLSLVSRVIAAVAALGSLALLAIAPFTGTTTDVLVVAAVLLAMAPAIRFAPRAWALAAGVLGALGVVTALAALLAAPLAWSSAFVDRHPAWHTPLGTHLPSLDLPSGWTVAALLAAAAAVLLVADRVLPDVADERPALLTVAPAAASLAVATGLSGSMLPLWLVVAGFAAAGALGAVIALRAQGWARIAAVILTVESAGAALLVASRSDLATAVLATALALVAGGTLLRSRQDRSAELLAGLAGAATVLLAGYAAATWTMVAGGGAAAQAYLLTAVAAGFALGASRVTRNVVPRVSLEVASGLVAVVACVIASERLGPFAAVLTLVGSAIALLSVLERDRVDLGWLGSGVLTVGTLVRLDLHSTLGPEVYTLPAAAVLLGAGSYRVLREPGVSTWRMLGSGLSLALGPSLLLALPEPTSLRAFLVGVGGAIALAAGMERRWQAPFLTGAGVLCVLALRFLLPLAAQILANPFGAWILFGLAGSACLVAGIMWEQSLRNLRVASRYVAALR